MTAAGQVRAAGGRFALGLTASLLLHGAVIALPAPGAGGPGRDAPLQARLLPAKPPLPSAAPAQIEHDNLNETAPVSIHMASPRPAAAAPNSRPAGAAQAISAPPRPAEELFYPPQAVAAGIEGVVKVRITLGSGGVIAQLGIAEGSGHAELDAAALRAAAALGRLPDAEAGELVLPVEFRLQP